MGKKNQRSRVQNSAFEFLGSGQEVPKAFLEGRIAAAKRQLAQRAKETRGINNQYAAYWSQIQKNMKPGEGPSETGALEGILEIHKKLAEQKLAAPRLPGGLGGIVTANFDIVLAPPFDYAFTLFDDGIATTPILDGFADEYAGYISSSAVSDSSVGENGGGIYSEMGIYFRPKLGQAVLRASINPMFSYRWWSNSIQGSAVESLGAGLFGLYEGTPRTPDDPYSGFLTGTQFAEWRSNDVDAIHFDFASNRHLPVSFQWDYLDPTVEYAVWIGADTYVIGQGWPGSLAGSMISVSVPSITLSLNPIQVLGPVLAFPGAAPSE